MADREQPLSGETAARVLVAGASGFAGALAAEIVWRHPRLELREATSRSDAGVAVRELYPRYGVPVVMTELDVDAVEECEAAIVAYPHHASAPVVAALRELGLLVVDLSADFRLHDPYVYREWYGELAAPDLLGDAVYGLTELHRERVREAELVANPGCYPTATVLGLAPLASAGLIADVVVDAKSGVSGAGRGGGDRLSFVSQTENLWSYLRNIVIPAAWNSADSWRGNWFGVMTVGPNALGTGRVAGGSGRFAKLDTEAVESWSAKAYSAPSEATSRPSIETSRAGTPSIATKQPAARRSNSARRTIAKRRT